MVANVRAFFTVLAVARSREVLSWGRPQIATCFAWARYFSSVRGPTRVWAELLSCGARLVAAGLPRPQCMQHH